MAAINTLTLSPSQQLHIAPEAEEQFQQLNTAFKKSPAMGLLALATDKKNQSWSPVLLFWRDFALGYFNQLCHTHSENTVELDPVPAPTPAECDLLLLNLPPMPGAEYCTQQVFIDLYDELNEWVRTILKTSETMGALIKKYLPHWSQVGRVCFHLAENKNDPELPFAFMATYAASVNQNDRVQYRAMNKALQEFAGQRNKKALLKLLEPVYEASKHCTWVKSLIDSNDIYYPLAWSPQEAYQLLQSVPELEQSGLLVRLPDWWKKKPRPRVQVTVGNKKQNNFGADSLLDFQLDVVLGDERISHEELLELLNNDTGLISMRGQWIEVDQDKLKEALYHWQTVQAEAAESGLTFAEGMRLLAGANTDLSVDAELDETSAPWAFVNAGTWLQQVLQGLRSPDSLTFKKPQHLNATLRPYQKIGVSWLYFLNELGLGACLADDMGLGKTIQIISLLLLKKQKKATKKSLLILPASLLGNWKSELARFAPTLKPLFVHTSEVSQQKIEKMGRNSDVVLQAVDVVITTYATLVRQDWLHQIDWDLIVIDEAQAIKNPSARQTKTIKNLKSRSRIALTGTPVENRLGDLWSLFDFLSPGLLGGVKRFKNFVKELESGEHVNYAPLRKLVQPYILRRLKTDKAIINDLPDKTEVISWCGLSKLQAKLYAKAVQDLKIALDKTMDGDVVGIKRRGLVLSFLTKFKQICNHPGQALGDSDYTANHSGKFNRLQEICDEIASRQEKVLIFTQYKEITTPIADYLTTIFGQSGLVLHGSTPVKHRKKMVDQFQDEMGPPFFVLSLKAGGTGLNLTAASHVIHFDRWWNPAVENQATDRAYRIGQKSNVLVHKFVCKGTIEEKVDQMITEKMALADDLLSGTGEAVLTEMNDKELLNLVALDVEQAEF